MKFVKALVLVSVLALSPSAALAKPASPSKTITWCYVHMPPVTLKVPCFAG